MEFQKNIKKEHKTMIIPEGAEKDVREIETIGEGELFVNGEEIGKLESIELSIGSSIQYTSNNNSVNFTENDSLLMLGE